MMQTPGFTGATLDRADRLRSDPVALATALADPRARLLLMDGLVPRVTAEGRLGWGAIADAPDDAAPILLGLDEAGIPHFAAYHGPVPGAGMRSPAIWAAITTMPAEEAALYGAARSVIDWHGRHRFCANCGSPTVIQRAGWGRRCAGCRTEHFPRVDPVVIMLAEHEAAGQRRILVGRQPGFPPGLYSALAGFVEPGESIEEAVARELHEEAGVRAISVRYVASQPWPFPSSLMIAAIAPVADDTIVLDANELEHALWATRDEIAAVMAGEPGAPFQAPPRFAIAHTLFTRWLAEQA